MDQQSAPGHSSFFSPNPIRTHDGAATTFTPIKTDDGAMTTFTPALPSQSGFSPMYDGSHMSIATFPGKKMDISNVLQTPRLRPQFNGHRAADPENG
jgi:hypothetical protein